MDWHPNRVASAYPLLLNGFWLEIKVGDRGILSRLLRLHAHLVQWLGLESLTIFRSYK